MTFGVILVEYRGAQGAKPNARTRDEALELAKQLAEDAKQDFKAAGRQGRPGSKENLGKIARGYARAGARVHALQPARRTA